MPPQILIRIKFAVAYEASVLYFNTYNGHYLFIDKPEVGDDTFFPNFTYF